MTLNDNDVRKRLETWCDVPPRYINCRLDSFDAYNEELRGRLELATRVASEGGSALLFGPPGVGKTHLAVGIVAEWVRRGARGKFVSALEYAFEAQEAYGNPREAAYKLLDQKHFVMVDDIGTQRDNQTARIALLYLIDRVYCDRQRLIATSNMTPAELNAFEPRLMSRVAEMGTLIEVKAEDYRIKLAARRQKAEKAERISQTAN